MEVPDDALTATGAKDLPQGWDKLPAGPESKRFGDAWVAANSSLGLLIPSVVASEEENLILNPSHPRFQEVRIISKQRVTLDKRLYSVPTKHSPGTQQKRNKPGSKQPGSKRK